MFNNPTLETYILTTEEASNLIDWGTKPIQHPLPTEVVLYPGTIYTQKVAMIWLSISTEGEYESLDTSGTKYIMKPYGTTSERRNYYYVAQIYRDTGTHEHVDYNLHGWLHITDTDLLYLKASYKDLYKGLCALYASIERGRVYIPLPHIATRCIDALRGWAYYLEVIYHVHVNVVRSTNG
jgi:hypothetical protein